MQSGKWRGSLPVNIEYGDEDCISGTHHYTESITKLGHVDADGDNPGGRRDRWEIHVGSLNE